MQQVNSAGLRRAITLLLLACASLLGMDVSHAGQAAQTDKTRALLPVLQLLILDPQAASIQLSLVPSRTSGVAPLYVFFDASGTSDAAVTTRPFHDLEYRWTFGDPTAGQWTYGSGMGANSKNAATGPIAGHIFETPGTYAVSLTAFDGINTETKNVQITVEDPDVVFAGTKTVCVSTDQDFSGCPIGAATASPSSFSAAIGLINSDTRRLLFKRGQTWNYSTMATMAVNGPGIIGAYGTGALPKILGPATNIIGLRLSDYSTPAMRDWRIMDLDIDGGNRAPLNGTSSAIELYGGLDQLTLLRLTLNGTRTPIINSGSLLDSSSWASRNHHIWDQWAVADNTITGIYGTEGNLATSGYGSYMSGERMFYAGNSIDLAGTAAKGISHVARFPYLGKAVIGNNLLQRPGPSEHNIKLHAPIWGQDTVESRGIGGGYTRWVVVSDNKIVAGYNALLAALAPQGADVDNRLLDIVSERNWFVAGPATQAGHYISGTEITLRNNLYEMSRGSNTQTPIQLTRRGSEAPGSHIRVYNESIYTSKAVPSNQFQGILIDSTLLSDVTVKNVLAYAPNALTPSLLFNAGAANVIASNNSTNAQVKNSNPQFVGPLTNPSGFALQAGSYGNAGGTYVPVFSDFFGGARGADRGLGAVGK